MRVDFLSRLRDLAGASLILLLLSPVIVVVALLIRRKIGAPIMFHQIRPGLNEKPFCMYKFRTMTDDRDSCGELLPDSERLHFFGAMLRSWSIDELPSLYNVITGEMSLVGPRPLLMKYLPLYNGLQARRHEVLPGLTGWAQVNGRNAISWQRKFEYDVWYVDNRTFLLDVKILYMTIVKVLGRVGVTEQGGVSMKEFTGSTMSNEND